MTNFDVCDICLLVSHFLVGLLVSFQNWKNRKLTSKPLAVLGGISVLWCLKQNFFPMTLVPIMCGSLIIWGFGKITKRPSLQTNTIALLASSSCFVFLSGLPTFLLISGIANGLLWLFLKGFSQKPTVPLAPAILLAQWATFFFEIQNP